MLWSQTLFDTYILCLYYMVVWAAMIPLFTLTTVRNMVHAIVPAPVALTRGLAAWVGPIIVLTCIAVAVSVFFRFLHVSPRATANRPGASVNPPSPVQLMELRPPMSLQAVALLALVLYVIGVSATFGIRSWIHWRRTGSTGFQGISGKPGSLEWWGGILFIAAMVLGATGPALALAGVVVPPRLPGLAWAGTCIAIIGFLGTLAAQSGMGASWRIGVDATEHTNLVTTGLFAVVRNPIFTAMLTAMTGIAIMVPTLVSATALACLFLAVEIQVRLVEEPYLNRAHQRAYARYTAKVGRFLPGIGRTRARNTAPH